jgi:hypothetical protein
MLANKGVLSTPKRLAGQLRNEKIASSISRPPIERHETHTPCAVSTSQAANVLPDNAPSPPKLLQHSAHRTTCRTGISFYPSRLTVCIHRSFAPPTHTPKQTSQPHHPGISGEIAIVELVRSKPTPTATPIPSGGRNLHNPFEYSDLCFRVDQSGTRQDETDQREIERDEIGEEAESLIMKKARFERKMDIP